MNGYFGEYGGAFVPDTLVQALQELDAAFLKWKDDESFQGELTGYLKDFVGRPSPLYFASRLSDELGCRVYLKREDLNHTGAHKINNTLGQILLAKRMGKKRIIAETGAGQHGVATATVAALMGLDCCVYMGQDDVERQALNVYRMKLMGAEVSAVQTGSRTLKDATTQAIRDWMEMVEDTYYIIGSVLGPHPYPKIVREFQRVIGKELKEQSQLLPSGQIDAIVACVGGGSNAMGIFYDHVDEDCRLIAVEAAGKGLDTHAHAASLLKGRPGVLHGSLSYLLQDDGGQIQEVHSISAGLDYPGVSPELSYLKDQSRIEVFAVTDQEALNACAWLARKEGIIPALESAHALALLQKGVFKQGEQIVVNLSGRGDKDMETLMAHV